MPNNEPLFLPKGSVRAILLILLTGAILIAGFSGVQLSKDIIFVWTSVVGLYFGMRSTGPKKNKNDHEIIH